jgi:hypothetical protein
MGGVWELYARMCEREHQAIKLWEVSASKVRSNWACEDPMCMHTWSRRQDLMSDQLVRDVRVQCMVSLVLFFSSVLPVASLPLAWSAVYECLGAAVKPVLTNKPTQFHDCRLLSEGTYPERKPSEVGSPPTMSNQD